jgi:hypothetical protein
MERYRRALRRRPGLLRRAPLYAPLAELDIRLPTRFVVDQVESSMYAPSPTMPNSGHPHPEKSKPESNKPRPPHLHPARPLHEQPMPFPKAPRI